MLTDIVTNIFNNIVNYITGQNAQDRFVNLLDSTPNILSDANQASGYPATDINNEIVSQYYNEYISRADLITKLTANEAVGFKFYQINDAATGTRIIQVIADSNITLYLIGLDVSTGETGTYDINTDVFTPIVVSGTPTLQQVTDAGDTTTNKVASSDGAGNATALNNGIIDILTGNIGTVSIDASLVTASYYAQLPDKPAGTETFAMLSDVSTPNIQQVLDEGNTSTTAIKIDNGTGNYVQVNSSNILMEDSSSNALSIYPDSITIQNPTFGAGTIKATTLANNVFFELPNKAAGTFTFAMTSDITAGGVPYTGATADVDLGIHSLTADTIGIGVAAGAEKLHIDGGATTTRVKIDADNGVSRILSFRTDDVQRWALRVDGIESGANSGGDFQLRRYNDAGAHIDNPIAINRANGNITTAQNINGATPTELGYLSGVTSAIQTQLDTFKKPISSVGNGTAVTGVVVNTYSKGLLIPANSRVANDVVQIDFQVAKAGAAGNIQLRFYWNTTNDLSGSPILLGTSPNTAALWLAFSRLLSIEVANGTGNATKVAPTSVLTLSTGYGTSTTATSTVAIDWTTNGYLICSILNASAADSSVCNMLKLL